MSIDLIFNDLSLVPLATDKYAAIKRMTEFVNTLRRARGEGIRGPLRVPVIFPTALLSPGYSLHAWTNDAEASRDERLYIKTLATKSPFLIDSALAETKALEYDFKINSQQASGCGAAYLLGGVCVSMLSDTQWDTHILNLLIEQIDETDIQTRSEEIAHASRSAHILNHQDWLKDRLAKSVNSGNDLWERRQELFPNLTFCASVERQVRELDYGTAMLQPVANFLFALEAFCNSWREGPFNADRISVPTSPESAVTLQDKRLAASRTFRCPDGTERIFSWHAKINIEKWRIHFHFDNAKPGTLLIGYIGRHLPTVSDRT